ncbi:hypothetical protein G7Z17_g3653 [Cylindrodendrum hubeiense]|uniref:Uncharacterized protein n=1 Tax=Cylindrodendrum hubeiense TaxID=595255 RepID=A0A9P5HC44_9HYPO|nr:hypothetical protein G7Z17_g3653 [Cylindrodendrum hubeiense]
MSLAIPAATRDGAWGYLVNMSHGKQGGERLTLGGVRPRTDSSRAREEPRLDLRFKTRKEAVPSDLSGGDDLNINEGYSLIGRDIDCVTIREAFAENGQMVYVTEFIPGGDLFNFITLKQKLIPFTLSQQIQSGRFDYPSPYWDSVGDTAQLPKTADAEESVLPLFSRTDSSSYGGPLYEASYEGDERTVQILIKQDADVNAKRGEYGKALQAASIGGHVKIVQILIEQGADVNATGGVYGNALQCASFLGHDKVVQILIEQGADVNVQGGICGNALQAALSRGHGKIVQILIQHGANANTPGGTSYNTQPSTNSMPSKEPKGKEPMESSSLRFNPSQEPRSNFETYPAASNSRSGIVKVRRPWVPVPTSNVQRTRGRDQDENEEDKYNITRSEDLPTRTIGAVKRANSSEGSTSHRNTGEDDFLSGGSQAGVERRSNRSVKATKGGEAWNSSRIHPPSLSSFTEPVNMVPTQESVSVKLSELSEEARDDLELDDLGDRGVFWTFTPGETPEEQIPLVVDGYPVVIPVRYQYPLIAIASPPPDPHPHIISTTDYLPDGVISEIFATFTEAIGFYLLINGYLQIIVPEDFDYESSLSKLPNEVYSDGLFYSTVKF